MKPIAIAFSDFHAFLWKKFNKGGSRTALLWKILKEVSDAAKKYNVPVLFPGDMFHNPKYLENALLREFVINYLELFEERLVHLYGISGNHDMSERNNYVQRSVSYGQTFSKVFKTYHDMDFQGWKLLNLGNDFMLYGVPYINGNVGFNKYLKSIIKNLNKKEFNVLMVHTDLPGATDIYNRKIDEHEGVDSKLFKHFNLVLDGHIHKPQRIGKNAYILGSPYQQTRSEKGLELGYWKIYRDRKPKFVAIDSPKFIDIPEGEPVPEDGNFYTVIKKPKENLGKISKNFHNRLDRSKLGKNYLNHIKELDKTKRKILLKTLNSVE
jgi:DNA repair exonuclease SbcCD nuclease subunit